SSPDARPVPSAGTPRRRTARPASARDRRRRARCATARGIREWSSCGWPLEDGIDGITGGAPGVGPGSEDVTPDGGDAVIAARRTGIRRLDEALQQSGALEVAQHRVQRALLAREHA